MDVTERESGRVRIFTRFTELEPPELGEGQKVS